MLLCERFGKSNVIQGIHGILCKNNGLLLARFMVVYALLSMKGCESTLFFFLVQTLVYLLKKLIRCFVHLKITTLQEE